MANTTNFNWETPDDTDLVKDGAAAIRTLGNSIDTSFVDLKGGTTGQYLKKNSNTDLDYVWGDVSANALTLLSTTTLSGSSTAITSIDQTYKSLFVVYKDVYGSAQGRLRLRLNGDTGSNHYFQLFGINGTSFSYYNDANLSYAEIGALPDGNTYYYQRGFGTFQINRYAETETHGFFAQSYAGIDGSGYARTGAVQYNSTTAISSLTFLPSTGTFTAGTVYVYGVK